MLFACVTSNPADGVCSIAIEKNMVNHSLLEPIRVARGLFIAGSDLLAFLIF